ncbi:MAG: hypothetical protein HYV09_32600 [Deltaproteobacteria bacterium]|nr:hypothetical protein [Deltaproteobacteria bacterium]
MQTHRWAPSVALVLLFTACVLLLAVLLRPTAATIERGGATTGSAPPGAAAPSFGEPATSPSAPPPSLAPASAASSGPASSGLASPAASSFDPIIVKRDPKEDEDRKLPLTAAERRERIARMIDLQRDRLGRERALLGKLGANDPGRARQEVIVKKLEERLAELEKMLTDEGLDAGADAK